MSDPKKFYLTTPIYYVNARPHIGHAYTTVVADVLARRHRLLGEDTFFLTGTDEHGQKIERSAAAAGIPPQQFTDEVSAQFRTLWDRMGLLNDSLSKDDPLFHRRFIRTTDPIHKQGAQKLFTELYNRGYIYLSTYTGAYCVSDEAFVDLPVGTPCPDCGRLLEQVTEENFFFRLNEFQKPLLDLIESNQLLITPDSARNEVLSFVRGNVTAYELPGLKPTTGPGGPSFASFAKTGVPGSSAAGAERGVSGEARASSSSPSLDFLGREEGAAGFSPLNSESSTKRASAPGLAFSAAGTPYVPGALKDLSVSRSSFTWGIPVPEEVQKAAGTQQNHVIYVWLDALANYMTAVGYGSDEENDKAEFARYWPADLHLVGKEITRFHCVYWPAFLLAAGLPTPKQITANGWLLFDNAKMSKSRGNVVRTETILEAFGQLCPKQPVLKGTSFSSSVQNVEDAALAAEGFFREPTKHERDLFASDVLRYFPLREIPFGQDGSFSFDAMVTRYNADLANGYGNLVSRTLKMLEQFAMGEIPAADNWSNPNGAFEQLWNPALCEIGKSVETNFAYQLEWMNRHIKMIDSLITLWAPWKSAKLNGPDNGFVRDSLYAAVESVRLLTALFYPTLPFATARVWYQLGLGDIEEAARNGELRNLQWGGLKPGTKLGPLAPIFPRADKSLAQVMIDMENERTENRELKTENSSRPETPLKSAATPAPAAPVVNDPTHPAAPPRALDEPAGALSVAGSTAVTTERTGTPPHTEAPASGIFGGEAAKMPADTTPQITIDDFAKIELRVAQVVVAERIPKADKLLRLEVDLGYEKRQILSGIAEWYKPEDLIGRRIVVITNLAPRKMRGLESHGMLLAASEGEGGKPVLATFGEDIALGSRLK